MPSLEINTHFYQPQLPEVLIVELSGFLCRNYICRRKLLFPLTLSWGHPTPMTGQYQGTKPQLSYKIKIILQVYPRSGAPLVLVKTSVSNFCSISPSAYLIAQLVKNLPAMQETQFDSWDRKIPWRRKYQPTLVFLHGESHGPKSLAGYSLEGHMSQTQLSD